jgi:hypothetical protein
MATAGVAVTTITSTPRSAKSFAASRVRAMSPSVKAVSSSRLRPST